MEQDKLIEYIKLHEQLYATNHPKYSDNVFKENAWREIAKQMNQPVMMTVLNMKSNVLIKTLKKVLIIKRTIRTVTRMMMRMTTSHLLRMRQERGENIIEKSAAFPIIKTHDSTKDMC